MILKENKNSIDLCLPSPDLLVHSVHYKERGVRCFIIIKRCIKIDDFSPRVFSTIKDICVYLWTSFKKMSFWFSTHINSYQNLKWKRRSGSDRGLLHRVHSSSDGRRQRHMELPLPLHGLSCMSCPCCRRAAREQAVGCPSANDAG